MYIFNERVGCTLLKEVITHGVGICVGNVRRGYTLSSEKSKYDILIVFGCEISLVFHSLGYSKKSKYKSGHFYLQILMAQVHSLILYWMHDA